MPEGAGIVRLLPITAPRRVTAVLLALVAGCGGPPAAMDIELDAAVADAQPPTIDAPPTTAIDAGPYLDAAPTTDAMDITDARPTDAATTDGADGAALDPCAGMPDGSTCDDNNKCTLTDRCSGGRCVGEAPIHCGSPNACVAPGTCDPDTGWCQYSNSPDGTQCDDGSVCTNEDRCTGGMCGGTDLPPPTFEPCSDGVCFTEIAVAAGLDIPLVEGPLVTGASAAWFDYDGDGLLDVAYGNETSPPRVFRNVGENSFVEVTAALGLPTALASGQSFLGIIAADYDNDGDTDLYYLRRGANALFRNDGGVFSDVTEAAGLRGDTGNSFAGAFADFDRDGDLDLYVGNYGPASSQGNLNPEPNVLYKNDGAGVFSDVTAEHEVAGEGVTLSVAWSDFDMDGDLDLFVCNDFGDRWQSNQLYINTAGVLTRAPAAVGANVALWCMSVAPGDINRDGKLDYYFSNVGANVLLQADSSGFRDIASEAQVTVTRGRCFTQQRVFSWGAGFQDFNADGWPDLHVANGHLPSRPPWLNPLDSANSVFVNNEGALPFINASRTARGDSGAPSRSTAFADFDADGDVDMLTANTKGLPLLLRNDSPNMGGLITITTVGRQSNRDGIGSLIRADIPGAILVQEMNPHIGFLSSSQNAVHIGIGAAEMAETLSVRWPLGIQQQLFHVLPGRTELVEPWVTASSAMPIASPVTEGTSLSVNVQLVNHRAAQIAVMVVLELQVPGAPSIVSAPSLVSIDASLTAATSSILTVPVGITNGGAVTVQAIVRVSDAGGGVDEIAVPVSIAP